MTNPQTHTSALGWLLALLLCLPVCAHAKDGRNLAVKQVNNAVSEQRIALVIGNSAYTNSPLKNPVNDNSTTASGFVLPGRCRSLAA